MDRLRFLSKFCSFCRGLDRCRSSVAPFHWRPNTVVHSVPLCSVCVGSEAILWPPPDRLLLCKFEILTVVDIKMSDSDIQAWTAAAQFRTVVFARARLEAGKIRTSDSSQQQFGCWLTIVLETAFVKVRAVAGNSRTFLGRPSIRGPSGDRIGTVPSFGRGNTACLQSQSSFVYVN